MFQDEYFSVCHAVDVVLHPVDDANRPHDASSFEQKLPTLYALINQPVISPSQEDKNSPWWRYVEANRQQNQQILRLLLQERYPQRQQTTSFGGSHFTLMDDTHWQLNQWVEFHLFLDDPIAAIFGYAQVTHAPSQNAPFYQFAYRYLLESNRDLLIQGALRIQQRQLRQRQQKK